MRKYVLFDLDGTLTDPALGITNSIMYALESFGIHTKERESLYKFIGPPLTESFMQGYGFTKERALAAVEKYRDYFSDRGIFENKIYPGIEDMLRDLHATGCHIALATSKPEVFAKKILDYFGIASYFSYIGGGDLEEMRNSKPDVIRYVLEKLGNPDVEECVMVGDRKFDALGAAAFDMDCIGVLYGYGNREELLEANARYIVEDVTQLHKILLEI